MPERNLADTFLTAATRDAQAYAKLASDLELHDSLAGFHAQQSIEKAIKAVLAHARVRFRRTHDIAELLDVLHDAGIATLRRPVGRVQSLRDRDPIRAGGA